MKHPAPLYVMFAQANIHVTKPAAGFPIPDTRNPTPETQQ